ncbi:MAG: AzlD domain-containing protein [Lautropia sp.]|nr:AzlD domain-containing protein [Lautropia sp.]
MISVQDALLATVVMASITFALRALPFVAAGLLRSHRLIRELGRFLPATILALLLIHTLLGFVIADWPTVGILPVAAGISLTLALQLCFRNALLSIFGGTGLYVLLYNLDALSASFLS